MTETDATTRDGRGAGEAHLRGPIEDGKPTSGFLATYLAACLVLITCAFGINVLGNSQNIYPSSLHPAQSDRPWKTRRLEQLVREDKSPRILILGNSRALAMNPAQILAITGKRTFNDSVRGGMIVDSLAQFRYALEIGVKPEGLVLEVDEWSFCEPTGDYQLQLAAHWGLFRQVPFPENVRIAVRVLQAATIESTIKNAAVIFHGRSSNDAQPSDEVSSVLLEDGYEVRPKWTREKAKGTYRMPPTSLQNANWGSLLTSGERTGEAQRMYDRRLRYLNELLALAKSIHCGVRVFMPPLRPEFENFYGGDSVRKIHAEFADRIRTICERYGYVFYNFTTLDSFGGDPHEFWDGTHQTSINMRRLTNVLFGVEPDKTFPNVPTDLEIVNRLPIGAGQ